MKEKILFVDDDTVQLSIFKDSFDKSFNITLAADGLEALNLFKKEGPFAVVISDHEMPKLKGIELLAKIKQINPDSIRILITAYGELNIALNAVNQGQIFRFHTKPCEVDLLSDTIKAAVDQYRLVMAERELLNSTLNGSIGVLTDIIELIEPEMAGFVSLLKEKIDIVTKKLAITNSWEIKTAAMLLRIGVITVPTEILRKYKKGKSLNKIEKEMMKKVPLIGYRLINKIPRLENVSKIILYQEKNFSGTGYPENNVKEQSIPLGARIIKILNDMETAQADIKSYKKTFALLESRKGIYDPKLLKFIKDIFIPQEVENNLLNLPSYNITVNQLKAGYIVTAPIFLENGTRLLSAGTKLTETMILRLKNWAKINKLKEPIRVAYKK